MWFCGCTSNVAGIVGYRPSKIPYNTEVRCGLLGCTPLGGECLVGWVRHSLNYYILGGVRCPE